VASGQLQLKHHIADGQGDRTEPSAEVIATTTRGPVEDPGDEFADLDAPAGWGMREMRGE
jgi:hypothetical protein